MLFVGMATLGWLLVASGSLLGLNALLFFHVKN